MTLRQVGAVLLALLTACSGTPQVRRPSMEEEGLAPEAARYELSVLPARTVRSEPVEVDAEGFSRAVTRLAREVRPATRPHEAAQRLFPRVRVPGHAEHRFRAKPSSDSGAR